MKTYRNYINGQWQAARSGELMAVINATTEEVFAQVPKSTPADVDLAVASAKQALPAWQGLSVKERASFIENLAAELKKRKADLVDMIVIELGAAKTFTQKHQVEGSIAEIEGLLKMLSDFKFEEEMAHTKILKEPFGVVACITPWNYPLNQIQRKIVPALLAGNTVVVKPASDTPVTALILAEIIDAIQLPAGVFNVLTGSGGEVGDYLAAHPEVSLISFTGSTEVGKRLYDAAKGQVKKLVLELGGKSVLLALPKGDQVLAIEKAMRSILNNQGQTCSALTRLLVPRDELAAYEAGIKTFYQEHVVVGDPSDEQTLVGPMVSAKQKETVLQYIEKGKAEGAKVLVGGEKLERTGFFVQPTVFSEVDNQMTIAQEEIFGPVLCVIPYQDIDEAISIANDSIYGLSGAVVGPEDIAYEVAKQLRTGNVWLNASPGNNQAPFGGYKQSGLGREKGLYGLEDYLEIKAIFV